MTPIELLDSLRALGVTLSAAADRLRADAPHDALTPELREALAEHKAALVALLQAPQGEGEPAPITQAPTRCFDPGVAALWAGNPEMQELIAWFRQEPFQTPSPWRLGPGRVIQDRWRFLFDLWADIQAGPDGPGAKSGALREDLRQLRECFEPRQRTPRGDFQRLYPCGRCGRPVRAVPDPAWPDHLKVDCPHGGYILRGDVDPGSSLGQALRQEGLEKPSAFPGDPTGAETRQQEASFSGGMPPEPLPPAASCPACGGEEYWVSIKGERFCLACHLPRYQEAITVGRLTRSEEPARPKARGRKKRAGHGREGEDVGPSIMPGLFLQGSPPALGRGS